MIERKDLSVIMQKMLDRNVTFMASPKLGGEIALYFAYHTGKENNAMHLIYDESNKVVVQPSDGEHTMKIFKDVKSAVAYVTKFLRVSGK